VFEKMGQFGNRVFPVYSLWGGSMNTPEFQAVQQEYAPKLAAFQDEIIQNADLFKRIEAVYKARDKASLTPEQKRLVEYHYDRFVLKGARLNDKQKKKVSEINQKLASLSTKFTQNVLKEEETEFLLLESKKDLEGLQPSQIEA